MDSRYDLTQGGITSRLLRFTLPMMLGALLQQCYNIADTLIVGRFIGAGALAAVGSAYTLMTFLTSVLLGLAMGSGTVFFPAIRREAARPAGAQRGHGVRPYRHNHGGAQHGCIRPYRSHHAAALRTGRHLR